MRGSRNKECEVLTGTIVSVGTQGGSPWHVSQEGGGVRRCQKTLTLMLAPQQVGDDIVKGTSQWKVSLLSHYLCAHYWPSRNCRASA